jgi:hypothetical protein
LAIIPSREEVFDATIHETVLDSGARNHPTGSLEVEAKPTMGRRVTAEDVVIPGDRSQRICRHEVDSSMLLALHS